MKPDYGHIENGRHRPYDLTLIRRLLPYARPQLRLLLMASLLVLAATAADLVLPYLTKIAVDRYIVVSAQEVAIPTTVPPELSPAIERLTPLLVPSGRPEIAFLPGARARELDPRDIVILTRAGLIRTQPLYIFPLDDSVREIIQRRSKLFNLHPSVGSIAVADLARLDAVDILSLRAGDVAGLAWLALILVVVLAVGWVFNFSNAVLLETAGQRLGHDLRLALLNHLLDQSLAFHDRNNTGRLVSRLTNDVQNLGDMIKSVATTFFKDAFILTGIVVILLTIDFRLALLTFTLVPVVIVISLFFRRLAREAFRQIRAKTAELAAVFGESISGLRVIQAFRREAFMTGRFDRVNLEFFQAGLRQIQVMALFMPMIDLIAWAALALVIWFGGRGVLAGDMTLGAVVAFIGYTRMFFQPIRDMAEKFNILQSALASLERIFGLLDQSWALPRSPRPAHPADLGGGLVFERVDFAYEPGQPVLREVSFTVDPGRTLAVVGATGAGKTSIINLLLRFHDPTSGRILVDGQDIRGLDLVAHRRRLGLVMQDVFLFEGTVGENIAFGRSDLESERVRAAARAVGAENFIQALPGGYDHYLGEGGRTLSVGQRQLLALARVLALDPRILILDEATANVDSDSEQLIEAALARLTTGRTSIIIAHRLSTIKRADRILALGRGRVVEMGTEAELLARRGLYYRLHQLQLREPREPR